MTSRPYPLITALCLLALIASGCSSEGKRSDPPPGTEADEGVSDVTASDAGGEVSAADEGCVIPEGGKCCPGEPKECVPGNPYQILVCSEDGTGHIPTECTSPDGTPSACLAGRCTLCRPGQKRCKDDDQVEKCDELGEKWQEAESCNGATTGRICESGACLKPCDVAAKLFTYIGCDYWAVDLDNAFVPGGSQTGFFDAANAQYSIVVSNPDNRRSADVEISTVHGPALLDSAGEALDLSPIPPGGLRILNLPPRNVEGTVIAPLAYRVQSSIPITAYQFNPLENVQVFSNDASLLLPSNVLGKYYIAMGREQTFESLRGYLTVLAVRPGETKVSVTVTAPTLASNEKDGTGKHIVPAMQPGDSKSFTLKQFDVLNIETNQTAADLTGTRVVADREVAVFGGSEASNVPNTNHCDFERGACAWQLAAGMPADQAKRCTSHDDCGSFITCCADHLEQQIFPVRTWGTRYLAAKSFDRNLESDAWRIMAAEDGTLVTTLPPQAHFPVLNRGEWYEIESREHFEIVSDKPILVGQYLAAEQAPDPNVAGVPTHGDAGTGDPAFILAVPVEQYRNDYVFLAPGAYAFDFVNIIAPVDAVVSLDGEVLEDELFEPITPEYRVTRRQIEDGVHRVSSDARIAIIVYGYDQYVSYGYPGGLDLRDLKLLKEDF